MGDVDLQAKEIYRIPTAVGTAYGKSFIFDNERYWLLVDMDNTPLTITSYRVALALTAIGLTTILLLLLILNIYSKRWITPLYEMRLYLQRLNTDNLSRVPQLKPVVNLPYCEMILHERFAACMPALQN